MFCAVGTSLSSPLKHRQKGRLRDKLKIEMEACVRFELVVRNQGAEKGKEKKEKHVM